MFAKFCINWLKRPTLNLTLPRYYFSNQAKLQDALKKIKV